MMFGVAPGASLAHAPPTSTSDVKQIPIPAMPWQVTGNHWLSLPCIHPASGSLYALGVLHRGARAALEFAGSADFLEGRGAPLLRPTIAVNGVARVLDSLELAWERALGWIPTFTCSVDGLLVRGTLFAPHGRDADLAGLIRDGLLGGTAQHDRARFEIRRGAQNGFP